MARNGGALHDQRLSAGVSDLGLEIDQRRRLNVQEDQPTAKALRQLRGEDTTSSSVPTSSMPHTTTGALRRSDGVDGRG
jgi:hypothetical protein